MKNKFFMLVIIGLIALLAACNFSGSDSGDKDDGKETEAGEKETAEAPKSEKQVLNLIASAEIGSLDILKEHGELTPHANTREGLYFIDKEHKPALAGAEKHEMSEDGLVHTFTLRDNKWSNGDPVTAYDYVYSWKRTLEEVGYYSYLFADMNIVNVHAIVDGEMKVEELGVEATDEKTFVVTLTEPNPLITLTLAFPAFGPMNQKFVEEAGEKYGQEHDLVLANGPFYISDWKHGQGWQFKKNEMYWDAANVKLEEVNVNVVKEESTAVNLYESGKVDVVELTASFIDKYQSDANYSTEEIAGIRFLRFNHNHKALGNENIRRALDQGWEKKGLTDVILKNGSKPMNFLVPGISQGPTGETFRSLNGDFVGTLEEAQELFKKGLAEVGITSLEVGLLTADDSDDKTTAEYLKDQWESNFEGLTVNIVLQTVQNRLELEKAKDYDISMSAYTPSAPDPQNYLNMWETGANFNRMDYSNPAYDELVNAGKHETDEAKRYDVLLQAEKMLFEDAAIGPMYQVAKARVKQGYVHDLVFHPTIPDYDLRWAYIEGK